MKVVFCVYGYCPENEPLQPWLTVHEVASYLLQKGWEVHLITDVNSCPSLVGFRHHYIKTMRPSNAEEMGAILADISPDRMVILTTPLNLAFQGWHKHVHCKVYSFLGYPFYTHAEYLRALPHLNREDLLTYGRHMFVPKYLWARTLRRFYVSVIAQSSRTAQRVSRAAGKSVEGKEIRAGLDLDFWTSSRCESSSAQANIRFLYVGSAKSIRGFDVLLRAFAKLTGAPVELRILARGSTEEEIESLRRRINRRVGHMRSQVEIIGGWMDKERYRDEIRAADIVTLPFVLVPSELPVSVIECIACGTPVIATDIDGLPDAVDDAGMIVRSGSVTSLFKAMRSVVDNPTRLDSLRANCLRARERMLDWPAVGREWMRVLSQ